jgi:hypothetical protein
VGSFQGPLRFPSWLLPTWALVSLPEHFEDPALAFVFTDDSFAEEVYNRAAHSNVESGDVAAAGREPSGGLHSLVWEPHPQQQILKSPIGP